MRASFGVYNEEPSDVVWKFKKEVAPDVKKYLFHPNQTMFEEADGSIKVSFKAIPPEMRALYHQRQC